MKTYMLTNNGLVETVDITDFIPIPMLFPKVIQTYQFDSLGFIVPAHPQLFYYDKEKQATIRCINGIVDVFPMCESEYRNIFPSQLFR